MQFELQDYTRVQGRLALELSRPRGRLQPLNMQYVHAWRAQADGVRANFPGGVGEGVWFDYAPGDQDWGELAAGLNIQLAAVDLLLKAESSVGRSDLQQQAFGLEIRGRF